MQRAAPGRPNRKSVFTGPTCGPSRGLISRDILRGIAFGARVSTS